MWIERILVAGTIAVMLYGAACYGVGLPRRSPIFYPTGGR